MSLTTLFLPQGSATQHVIHVTSGGGICGGSVAVVRKLTIATSGGAIGGGETVQTRKASFAPIGGGVVGGSPKIMGTLGRSSAISPSTVVLNNGKLAHRVTDTFYLVH